MISITLLIIKIVSKICVMLFVLQITLINLQVRGRDEIVVTWENHYQMRRFRAIPMQVDEISTHNQRLEIRALPINLRECLGFSMYILMKGKKTNL